VASLGRAAAWALALAIGVLPARGATIDTGTTLDLAWTNDIRLSAVNQLGSPPPGTDYGYAGEPGSARVDWRSTLDLENGDYGLRVETAAWWDPGRGSAALAGSVLGAARDEYGHGYLAITPTQTRHDEIELADAFVRGAFATDDDERVSFRIGREVLLWGESLYFPTNGVAGGLGPVDTRSIQLASTYEAGDEFLPVGQVSASWQPVRDVTIDAYAQLEYRQSRFDTVAAYANGVALLGGASEAALDTALPPEAFARLTYRAERRPGSPDQLGAALRWQDDDVQWGVYALRFDAKVPVLYLHPPDELGPAHPGGTYDLVIPRDIELYGASVGGPVGDATAGAEISARRNMPLATGGIVVPATVPAGTDPLLHPAGDTLQGQASWTVVTGALPGIPDAVAWTGEVAGNGLLDVTANPGRRMPDRTRWAAAIRTVVEPRFFQILPRLDLTVPIGLGYNFLGRSPIDPMMTRGSGDIDVGLTARIDEVWRVTVGATHYFGKVQPSLVPYPTIGADRPSGYQDFATIALERSY
jgi:hypothetical protein